MDDVQQIGPFLFKMKLLKSYLKSKTGDLKKTSSKTGLQKVVKLLLQKLPLLDDMKIKLEHFQQTLVVLPLTTLAILSNTATATHKAWTEKSENSELLKTKLLKILNGIQSEFSTILGWGSEQLQNTLEV